MAEEQKERALTTYRVLRQHPASDGAMGAGQSCESYEILADVSVANAPSAIRGVVEAHRKLGVTFPPGQVFVAVPVSSWTARGVAVEVQESLVLSDPSETAAANTSPDPVDAPETGGAE